MLRVGVEPAKTLSISIFLTLEGVIMQPDNLNQGWLARVRSLRFRIKNFHVRFEQPLLHKQEQWRLNDDSDKEDAAGFLESIKSRMRGSLFAFFEVDPLIVDSANSTKEILRNELTQRRTNLLQRLKFKMSLKERAYDFVFYFLDYDPTNNESGEKDMRLMPAIIAWFHRIFLTRWIEIVGIVMVVVTGLFCYYAIVYS